MTVTNVNIGLPSDYRASGGKFSLPGAGEFANTLNLGQIIKGKVMRQFEGGGRYLVNFDGHEKVVDSTVPLTTGELIHGRVMGLGDRVEVQRVYPANDANAPAAASQQSVSIEQQIAKLGRHERLLDNFAGRFRTQLNPADKSVLMRASRMASDPVSMTMVGVMMSKLGLRQSPDLLWPVYRSLVRENSASASLITNNEIPQLAAVAGADANAQATSVRQLADMLAKQIEQRVERKESERSSGQPQVAGERNTAVSSAVVAAVTSPNDQQGDQGADGRTLARRLLNVQTGGSVAHRIGTVPLLLGDRLVEVDLSFFEQNKEQPGTTGTKHRKVMFSLQMERLGNVEVAANLAGTHARLQIITSDQEATAAVSAHVDALRSALTAAGWEVDEIVYETRQPDNQNGVVRSVVEHVIAQDSLNRLV